MNEADYKSYPLPTMHAFLLLKHVYRVVEKLRLADGSLFPIPVNLDISKADVDLLGIKPGARIALRDPRDDAPLAILTGTRLHWNEFGLSDLGYLTVEDIYTPDKVKESTLVFGADDPAHPSVSYLRNRVRDLYVGGKVQAIQAPTHYDYVALRCEWSFA